jgi:hypothetical protein
VVLSAAVPADELSVGVIDMGALPLAPCPVQLPRFSSLLAASGTMLLSLARRGQAAKPMFARQLAVNRDLSDRPARSIFPAPQMTSSKRPGDNGGAEGHHLDGAGARRKRLALGLIVAGIVAAWQLRKHSWGTPGPAQAFVRPTVRSAAPVIKVICQSGLCWMRTESPAAPGEAALEVLGSPLNNRRRLREEA